MNGYYPNRRPCNKACPKQNFNFAQKKENALCSLYQVENFLCQFSKALKCFNLYHFFK